MPGLSEHFDVSIKAARNNANMTLDEWATSCGVSKSTAWKWENGKGSPSASQLRKISELSRIPMDYIFIPEQSD